MSVVALDDELLAVFLPEANRHLTTIAEAGDAEARAQAAHGLRGACAMLGLSALEAEARALEEALRSGSDGAAERERIQRALASLITGAPADLAGPSPEWDPDELRTLRAFFVDEAAEHLEAVEAALAELRSTPASARALAAMLRKLHTFKGSAGSVLLTDLSQGAHGLEDRVIALRDRGRPLQPDEIEQIAADTERLRRLLAEADAQVRGRPEPHSPTGEARAASDRRFHDRRLDQEAQTVRVEVERIDELMDAASELVFDRTRIQRRLQELEGCLRDLGTVQSALAVATPSLEARLAEAGAPELAARLGEIGAELSSALAAFRRAAQGGAEDAEGLARTSATLQERMRRVRMMAVGRLLARLEQPVRDLARREGKQVRWVTAGEEVEIDKAVVERIAEPLLHLVRNAVAHGIEPPEVRHALGKPREGTLTVSARHEGDAIELRVEDDGQGIDLEAVRRALVSQRRVSQEEAAALDADALYVTLFQPGLSTRDRADDVAGRGVGLDAVNEALTRLGGSVRVSSVSGRGASFAVRLPLTTAVQQALLFKVGGQVYAVPAARVKEALTISLDDIVANPDGDHVLLPGHSPSAPSRVVPLVRTGALLGVPPPPGQTRRAALLLSSPLADPGLGGEVFAMSCDKIIGPREIVVRSLGPLLQPLPLYAGATISGAGKVQLILDVAYLAERARRGVQAARPQRAIGPRRVLVVDDSRSIREAAGLILLQAGYAVEAVPDGWDAWELLQDRPFDVLVTDLEMPRLDGHELISRVRRSPELSLLPVVVVSSRTADSMRARVTGAGADAFVSKPLRRKALLDAIDAALKRAT